MKRKTGILLLAFTLALLFSCASTKTSKLNSPLGEWSYTIKGTPQGDFAGTMVIIKTDKGYSGKMVSNGGEIPFQSTSYSSEENKIVAEFDYTGMAVTLTGLIDGLSMTGTVTTSGYEFPLSASRKN